MGELEEYGETISGGAEGVSESIRQAPRAIERRTRGNPLAVGLIAVGAGALIASLLPETQQERRMARKVESHVGAAASEVEQAGREMAEDVKQSASESMERVKDSAREESQKAKEEARHAGERIREGS